MLQHCLLPVASLGTTSKVCAMMSNSSPGLIINPPKSIMNPAIPTDSGTGFNSIIKFTSPPVKE